MKKQLKQTLGRKATKRLYRAAPWVGAAVAIGVGSAAARKGTFRGAIERVVGSGASTKRSDESR